MKAPKVNSINVESVKVQIKKCPLEVQQYISALERSLERQKDVTNEAIKKIKKLSSKAPEKEEEKKPYFVNVYEGKDFMRTISNIEYDSYKEAYKEKDDYNLKYLNTIKIYPPKN